MEKEYNAYIANSTWHLETPTSDQNIIDCKWGYKLKISANTSIEPQVKARLVTRRFFQIYGFDFTETFAPVAKHSTIQLLCLIAAKHKNEKMQQLFSWKVAAIILLLKNLCSYLNWKVSVTKEILQ